MEIIIRYNESEESQVLELMDLVTDLGTIILEMEASE